MIKDEFTKLTGKLSRQRIWQLRQAAKGLCILCNRKRVTGTYCEHHARMFSVRNQKPLAQRKSKPYRSRWNPMGTAASA